MEGSVQAAPVRGCDRWETEPRPLVDRECGGRRSTLPRPAHHTGGGDSGRTSTGKEQGSCLAGRLFPLHYSSPSSAAPSRSLPRRGLRLRHRSWLWRPLHSPSRRPTLSLPLRSPRDPPSQYSPTFLHLSPHSWRMGRALRHLCLTRSSEFQMQNRWATGIAHCGILARFAQVLVNVIKLPILQVITFVKHITVWKNELYKPLEQFN